MMTKKIIGKWTWVYGILIMTSVFAGNDVFGENNKTNQIISLWPENPKIKLEVFLPQSSLNTGTGIVVCPGGAYGQVVVEKEGYEIAQWLNSIGAAAFVLSYHITTDSKIPSYPWPIKDGRKAVSIVRCRAAQYGIKPDKLGIMGFSAGGHLASTVGTHWQKASPDELVNDVSCRPDFMVLLYPVISFKKTYGHMGSRQNLIGSEPNESLVEELSNELHVDGNTPPSFLVHATDDKAVPVENSIMFYSALKNTGVSTELHIFSRGGHGFGLGFSTGYSCDWRQECVEWMRDLKFLNK
ncbi:MAG: alpha/beta hydrolase [Phycisphaerales bacterium]